MLKVNFPKTKVPVITRLHNLVKTKGDILTPKERSYAEFLTKELRENLVPWAEKPEMNDRVIADIRKEFAKKIEEEEPKEHKKIISNVEDYVFKEAQYHFNIMSNPSVQEKIANVCPTSAKVLENAVKRDTHWKSIEEILGTSLERNENWQEIETKLKEKNISRKQRQFCYNQYQKIIKYDTRRVNNVIQRENQLAANEKAAKEYGFWKSYDYVYNMPTVKK